MLFRFVFETRRWVFVAATVFGAGVSSLSLQAVVVELSNTLIVLIVCLTFSAQKELGMMGVHPVVQLK